MKKALSFVLAMVLVFAMSVPALAVDVPDENTSYSTFSDYLNISFTHSNLDQKAKDFLSEWRNSGSNYNGLRKMDKNLKNHRESDRIKGTEIGGTKDAKTKLHSRGKDEACTGTDSRGT